MAKNDLITYVETARKSGASDKQIHEMLLKSGWGEQEIAASLSTQNSKIPVPPPPPPHFGMWVAFLYIILFISLYVSATALGGVMHHFVDEKIPDTLDAVNNAYSFNNYLMQGYMASLIVGFPIFASLFLFLKNMARKRPAVKGLKSRKLLVYLTLVGTFLIMLCHIIYTVYQFLGGSITTRSLAHLVVTLLVAGSIFIYFLIDVAGDRKQS